MHGNLFFAGLSAPSLKAEPRHVDGHGHGTPDFVRVAAAVGGGLGCGDGALPSAGDFGDPKKKRETA
jgi:hypothetical protein